jgi:hypothetical protein
MHETIIIMHMRTLLTDNFLRRIPVVQNKSFVLSFLKQKKHYIFERHVVYIYKTKWYRAQGKGKQRGKKGRKEKYKGRKRER